MNPLLVFWLFLKASLFSTGGMGNLPSLHSDLIARRWATDRQFAEAIMIGQASPGPNGLWAICLGYLVYGYRGAALALVALSIPPLVVLVVRKAYVRVQDHPAVEGFMRGLSIGVAAISIVILCGLPGGLGAGARGLCIVAASIGLGLTRRIPLPLILAAAAAAGIVFHK